MWWHLHRHCPLPHHRLLFRLYLWRPYPAWCPCLSCPWGYQEGQKLSYAGRPASASPAVGYYDKHFAQQKDLLDAAFGGAGRKAAAKDKQA